MAKDNYPDWKDYEKQIYKSLTDEYINARVKFNEFIIGNYSEKKRQIDISITYKKNRKPFFTIAECKCFKRKIDVGMIDSLIGKMIDVGADSGIFISTKGFTSGAETYAKTRNISFRQMPFDFLKDFGFTNSNYWDEELYQQETEYFHKYCPVCEVTNLFEIKVLRGYAFYEDIICPKCKAPLANLRTDGGHHVIKIFEKENISRAELDSVIVDHLINTREKWDKKYTYNWEFIKDLSPESLCYLCHKKFSDHFPSSYAVKYKGYKVCNECCMSSRTLLIDNKKAS